MTLHEVLQRCRPLVKVGAIDGDGFLYCGPVGSTDPALVGVLDREVKNFYPSVCDGVDIVLVEGGDHGGNWTLKDYTGEDWEVENVLNCDHISDDAAQGLVTAVMQSAVADMCTGLAQRDRRRAEKAKSDLRHMGLLGEHIARRTENDFRECLAYLVDFLDRGADEETAPESLSLNILLKAAKDVSVKGKVSVKKPKEAKAIVTRKLDK